MGNKAAKEDSSKSFGSKASQVDWTFHKVFPNGDKFNGDWVDDKAHGKGSMTYSTSNP